MQSVVRMNVIRMNVVGMNVVGMNVVGMNVVMINVVMMNVIMLNVVVPKEFFLENNLKVFQTTFSVFTQNLVLQNFYIFRPSSQRVPNNKFLTKVQIITPNTQHIVTQHRNAECDTQHGNNQHNIKNATLTTFIITKKF